MKIKSIVFLMWIFTNVAFSQAKKCSDFKVGTFAYKDPRFENIKIVRENKIQTETDVATGSIMEGSIEWKSDCEYILTYVKVSDEKSKQILGQKIYVRIIPAAGNEIMCKTEAFGVKLDCEMVKIKD